MSRIVFSAGTLVDSTGGAPLQDAYVLVENGCIEEVASGRAPQGWVEGAERVDMPEATIIPGIVDAHLHLALALQRADWAEIDADPRRMTLVAAHGAQETLRAGVTTIGDCGARYSVTIPLREAIAGGELPGSRLWACGEWLTVTNGHGYFWTHWGLDNADELRKGVRRMVWEGADFIKIMASGGSTHGAKTNRRRAQYGVEELRAAVEDAHRLNKRVHCHVNATEAMRHCIEAGVDVVEHCNWLGVQEGIIEYDDAVARLGGRKGIYAGINCEQVFWPLSSYADGCAQDWGEMTRWDLMRRMQDAGMHIFVNTDAIGRNLGALPGLMQRMVDEGKATAQEVLAMSTLVPAQAMGIADRVGSLEKGKWADMLFLPGNPLVDMSAVTRPLLVVKEGKVVVRGGTIAW